MSQKESSRKETEEQFPGRGQAEQRIAGPVEPRAGRASPGPAAAGRQLGGSPEQAAAVRAGSERNLSAVPRGTGSEVPSARRGRSVRSRGPGVYLAS